jgi:hypothetical protein
LTDHQRWIRLSLSGQEAWGDIFPYGRIPINSISTQKITFEATADPESIMSVDWKQLPERQREAILERLNQQRTTSTKTVLGDMLKIGLHIRRSHIDCCGIDEWNYLC